MLTLTKLERTTLPPIGSSKTTLSARTLRLVFLVAFALPLFISTYFQPSYIFYVLLLPLLWRMTLIDIHYHLLPNIYCLALGAGGLLIAALTPELSLLASSIGIIGGLFGGLLINFLIRILTGHTGGLGGGDIKFIAAAGAWLGIGLLPIVLWLAFFFMLPTFFQKRQALPFGPTLILAFWLTLLFKNTAADLILSLPLPI